MVALTAAAGFAEAQATFTWNPAGPIYTAGRARNMVVDKNDASGNTLYVGSTSSGVFTSTNGGVSWAPLDDQGTVRNVSYMSQSKDGTIWVATGEGFLRLGQKAKAQRGSGLYKLQGSTLTRIQDSTQVGAVINRIACDPNDNQRMALATNKGIMVSSDGGNSFTSVSLAGITSTLASGQDVKFNNAGILFASAGSELNYGGYGAILSKVYRFDYNLSNAPTAITPTNAILPDFRYGRIELAVSLTNNNIIYACCAAKNTSDPTVAGVPGSPASAFMKGIFVSYDAGANWGLIAQGSSQLDPLTNGGTVATGDYAQVLLVNPSNNNQVFIGGYSFYIFTRNGGSDANPVGIWTRIGSSGALNSPLYLHENIHDIKIVPGSPNSKFYFVTDAGIYRSTDMNNIGQSFPPSFQPFYNGLVTGQFNSVSIERYPRGSNTGTTAIAGQSVNPNSGFIGGTGANGLTYYSGTYSLVSQETNYLGGEVYNAEYSRILDGAALMSTGNGGLYRSTNVKTSAPTLININKYTGATIAKTAPAAEAFSTDGVTTGTPFRLWENYGQINPSPDSAVFYNDTVRFPYSMSGISTLTTQTTFTFSADRPYKSRFALIDSIVIRTGTVVLATTSFSNAPAFTGTNLQDITIKLNNNYAVNSSTVTPPITKVTGPVAASGVTLNAATRTDIISVTFTAAPFATFTTPYFPVPPSAFSLAVVPDAAAYYRVFATVFYKYKKGDSVSVIDQNISTKTATYTGTLNQDLRWTLTYVNQNVTPSGPKTVVNKVAVVNTRTNPVFRIATTRSARLAMILTNNNITGNTINNTAIVVSKNPLALNDPMNFVRVSQHGARMDSTNGAPTTKTISISGKPTLLEWSKRGTEIYYATNDNKVYRVSHINDIMDLSQASYNGKLYTDVFTYTAAPVNANTINPVSPYRTTLIGTFTLPISAITVSKDDQHLVITFKNQGSAASADGLVMYNTNDASKSDASNIGWVQKGASTLNGLTTYCSLVEKDDIKKVFMGTDNGIFYTSDITAASPLWSNINTTSQAGAKLPNVQVFDIKQQLMDPWDCYNSGQIYVATNGRGIWTTSNFMRPLFVGIEEFNNAPVKEGALSIYPNPANGDVNIKFNGMDGESATLTITDISGRLIGSQNLGKVAFGETTHSFSTSGLSTGVYMVSVNSDAGKKRVAKLIVTK